MRKLLLIVFVLLCGLAKAQTPPPLEFKMEKTYFCVGETIMFDTTININTNTYAEITIRGPLNEDGTDRPPVTRNYTLSQYISPCGTEHEGWYRLRARINGILNNNVDNIYIHVQEVHVELSAVPNTISPGGTTMLIASGADYYSWETPSNNCATLTVVGPQNNDTALIHIGQECECGSWLDFSVRGYVNGDNRVENSDFESGNSGFYSAYGYRDPSYYNYSNGSAVWQDGYYTVHDEACEVHYSTAHPEWGCWDNPRNHDSVGCGSGKYLIVNGNTQPNAIVWQQTITVRPNVDYAFSANVCSLSNTAPANLYFSINGQRLGEIDYVAKPVGDGWTFYYQLWTSGPDDHSAVIRLIDTQTDANGNDFGIDNITFYDLMSCEGQATTQVQVVCDVTVGDIQTPDVICDLGTLDIDAPSVTINAGSSTYSTYWEIGPTPIGPWQLLPSLSNVSSNYNGWYIHYVVLHGGDHYNSNAVPITVVPPVNVHIEVEGDNPAICPDDTITLTAVADTIVLNYVSVGDILCEDGGTVKRAKWGEAAADGRVAKGIVFYVDDTKWHGWAVSLTQTGPMAWSTEQVSIDTTYANWSLAIKNFDGYGNTQAITHAGGSTATTYPAAWSAVGFGNGWYLPAAGQLNMLYGELWEVNLSLDRVGGTSIVDNVYIGANHPGNGNVLLWSSTQGSSRQYAIVVEVADGWVGQVAKTSSNKHYVRAVIDF